MKQDLPGDKRKLGRSGSGKYSSFNTMSEQAVRPIQRQLHALKTIDQT